MDAATPVIDEAAFASNPKDVVGIRKTPFSTLSGPVLAEMGVAMLEGALKYGRHNYRVVGVRYSIYFDACMRHLWAAFEGEDIDPESGKPHLVKAMTCLLVLRDAQLRGLVHDDRPPKMLGFFEANNADTKSLLARHPSPQAPYTELGTAQKEFDDVALEVVNATLRNLGGETKWQFLNETVPHEVPPPASAYPHLPGMPDNWIGSSIDVTR